MIPPSFNGVQLYRGRGCDRCKNSGYAGRMAIIEAMTITDQIRKLIIARANTREMGKVAVSQGMRTLRMVGTRPRPRRHFHAGTGHGDHLGALILGTPLRIYAGEWQTAPELSRSTERAAAPRRGW